MTTITTWEGVRGYVDLQKCKDQNLNRKHVKTKTLNNNYKTMTTREGWEKCKDQWQWQDKWWLQDNDNNKRGWDVMSKCNSATKLMKMTRRRWLQDNDDTKRGGERLCRLAEVQRSINCWQQSPPTLPSCQLLIPRTNNVPGLTRQWWIEKLFI